MSKPGRASLDSVGQNIFNETGSDNKLGPSIEDTIFLEKMDREMYRDKSNHWVAALPFREQRQQLSNNSEYAMSRFNSLKKDFNKETRHEKPVSRIH